MGFPPDGSNINSSEAGIPNLTQEYARLFGLSPSILPGIIPTATGPGGGPEREKYTTSDAFFEALWEAGVTHCFVNLGSDHPSIIEAMVRGARERGDQFPKMVTCPNEMVAMSMADGFARLTGKPQCVIVHVDVGTQGLGAAVHNASMGRAPVLIFAGLSPFTIEGELKGSRTEFIHWLQDVPDQKQILGQYCRYTAEIKTGRNVKQMVNRALSFATSSPAGPVYLCGAREVMEENIEPYQLNQQHWKPVQLGGLPQSLVEIIASALSTAVIPLLIIGYAGRNQAFPPAVCQLADALPHLLVLDSGGSDMNFPADHPAWLGLRYGEHKAIPKADVIVVIDCDVPWINTRCRPAPTARVFHIDCDPLKKMMPVFYIPAKQRILADSLLSVQQLSSYLDLHPVKPTIDLKYRNSFNGKTMASILFDSLPFNDDTFGAGHLAMQLREICPVDTIWAVEAVTNTVALHGNLKPRKPGQWINCGGGGLGWSGGGALGIKMATDHAHGGPNMGRFVCQIVGDGAFLFSVPSSVYWISQRYNIPILTIVLNNNGWNAPRRSLLLVHPNGLGSQSTNEEINIAFNPSPDYGGIAKAAAGGHLYTFKVAAASQLRKVLQWAVIAVQAGASAVVDCSVVKGSEG